MLRTFIICCALFVYASAKSSKKIIKSTDHFNYLYESTEGKLIENIAAYCELEFNRISMEMGFVTDYNESHSSHDLSFNKFKIAIEISSDVKVQNSVILDNQEILKRKIKLSSVSEMKTIQDRLSLMIAQVLVGNMVAGPISERRKTVLRNANTWFIYGGSCYFSSAEYCNVNHSSAQQLSSWKELENLKPEEAMNIGTEVFTYIDKTYGKSTIVNIYNLFTIIRDVKKAIAGTLGVDYASFMSDWLEDARGI